MNAYHIRDRDEENRRRTEVLNRLRWRPEGVDVTTLRNLLGWPSGIGLLAVLRELRDQGDVVERNGRYLLAVIPAVRERR